MATITPGEHDLDDIMAISDGYRSMLVNIIFIITSFIYKRDSLTHSRYVFFFPFSLLSLNCSILSSLIPFCFLQLLKVANELKIFDELEKHGGENGVSAKKLSSLNNWNDSRCERLLNALVSIKMVTKDNDGKLVWT